MSKRFLIILSFLVLPMFLFCVFPLAAQAENSPVWIRNVPYEEMKELAFEASQFRFPEYSRIFGECYYDHKGAVSDNDLPGGSRMILIYYMVRNGDRESIAYNWDVDKCFICHANDFSVWLSECGECVCYKCEHCGTDAEYRLLEFSDGTYVTQLSGVYGSYFLGQVSVFFDGIFHTLKHFMSFLMSNWYMLVLIGVPFIGAALAVLFRLIKKSRKC